MSAVLSTAWSTFNKIVDSPHEVLTVFSHPSSCLPIHRRLRIICTKCMCNDCVRVGFCLYCRLVSCFVRFLVRQQRCWWSARRASIPSASTPWHPCPLCPTRPRLVCRARWCGVVWCGVVWCGVVCCVVLCRVVSCGLACRGVV